MEEKQGHSTDEEKNIFYEYFELKSKPIITYDTKIDECKNLFYEHFQEFIQKFDIELQKVWNNNRSTTAKILSTIKLYKNSITIQCIDDFKEILCLLIKFFEENNLYTEDIRVLLSLYRKSIAYCDDIKETNKGNIGLVCEISNVIEYSYIMYKCIVANDIYTQSFHEGLRILNINVAFYIRAIITITKAIVKIIDEGKTLICSIALDILRTLSHYKFRFNNEFLVNKEDFPINYLLIAEKAYSKQISKSIFLKEDKHYRAPKNIAPLSNAKKIGLRDDAYFSFYGFVSGFLFNHKNTEIVIAFSGTKSFQKHKYSCILNWIVNLSQLNEISCSYIFAVGFVNHIKNIIPNNNFVLCGHSLGGGLAQFAAATQKGSVKAVCFNSAGLFPESFEIISKFKPWRNIYHYRLENDIVSKIGELIGEVYTIKYPKCCCHSHGIEDIKKALNIKILNL